MCYEFSVVSFEDNSVCTVPSCWLRKSGSKTLCYWPPFKKTDQQKLKNHIALHSEPLDTWKLLEVRTFYKSGDYQKARQKENNVLYDSDVATPVESEAERRDQRHSKRRLNYQIQNEQRANRANKGLKKPKASYSSESECLISEESGEENISHLPEPPKNIFKESSNLSGSKNVTHSGNFFEPSNEHKQNDEQNDVPRPARQSVERRKSVKESPLFSIENKEPPLLRTIQLPESEYETPQRRQSFTGSTPSNPEIWKKVLENLAVLTETVQETCLVTRKNNLLLTQIFESKNRLLGTEHSLSYPGLPVTTREELLKLMDCLEKNGIQSIVEYFKTIGGVSTNQCVYNICLKLMTNEVAKQVNISGANGKVGLKHTALVRAVRDSVAACLASNITEHEVCTSIAKWSKGSVDRHGGRKQRQKTKDTNIIDTPVLNNQDNQDAESEENSFTP